MLRPVGTCTCPEPDPYAPISGPERCHRCFGEVPEKAVAPGRVSIEDYALALAETASTRSEDPYRKVGACLLRADRTVASLGYNGAPPGVEIDWSDRDARRRWVIHAEANALRYVRPGEVWLLTSTALPCEACMLLIASMGVARVYFRDFLDPAVYDNGRSMEVARLSGIVAEQAEQAPKG